MAEWSIHGWRPLDGEFGVSAHPGSAGIGSGLPEARAGADGTLTLPLSAGTGSYLGWLDIANAGTLVFDLVCPRPLRLRVRGVTVVDEPLYWRSFQRELRGAAVLPVRPGRWRLEADVGDRISIDEYAEAHCPSRNRQRILEQLARLRPDVLTLRAELRSDSDDAAGNASVQAFSLRYLPAQFTRDGIRYQHLLVRELAHLLSPPDPNRRSSADKPEAAELFVRAGISASMPVQAFAPALRTNSARAGGQEGESALFFVPVAREDDLPQPLRAVGRETRIEPYAEIAGELTLQVGSAKGGLPMSVRMPVYEPLGRLSPDKAYRTDVYPSADELLAAVPQPVLPERIAGFRKLYDAAWRMLLGRVRQPREDSGLPRSYISTGSNFPYNQFVWDTSFTAICAAYAWRALPAEASLDNVYATQFDGGYIHREFDVRDRMPVLFEPDFGPNPPILTLAERSLAALTGDAERLRRVYPALCAYHVWIREQRRLSDGTYWTTGLANGLDNSPSFGRGYPCLTAQMAHDAELLGEIALLLGHEDEADEWRREREATARALNDRLWNGGQSIYSASLETGGHNPNKIVTAFWPLFAGIAPPDRAAALAAHLIDPASFGRLHPIPSTAADSPFFERGGNYWRGSAWAPTNYAAIRGFQRSGYIGLARETAIRHIDAMLQVYETTGEIWENYDCDSPNRGSASSPSYSWSALGPIALLLETVIGLEPNALDDSLFWAPPAGERIGVRNYALGDATISLLQQPDDFQPDDPRFEAASDRPFRLDVELDGTTRVRHCLPGRQSWRWSEMAPPTPARQ